MTKESNKPEQMTHPTAAQPLVARREVVACLGGIGAVLLFDCFNGSGAGTNSVVGTWTVSFQWPGRTPGVLTLVVSAGDTCQQLAGPGVGAASGTISANGDDVTWVLSDGTTWTATQTSTTTMAGSMTGANGTGTFTACAGTETCSTPSDSGGLGGSGGSGGSSGCGGGCSGGCTGCGGGCTGGCSGLCQGSCSGCAGGCQGAD